MPSRMIIAKGVRVRCAALAIRHVHAITRTRPLFSYSLFMARDPARSRWSPNGILPGRG